MAFLDGLGKTLADLGKDAAQKTKGAVDVLQMKTQINAEKSKLHDLYAAMGQSYYEQHKEEAKEAFSDICDQVEGALDKIKELEEKIKGMDNTVICPVCGASLPKEAVFCSKCGSAVTNTSAGAAQEEETGVDKSGAENVYEEAAGEESQKLAAAAEEAFDESDSVSGESLEAESKPEDQQ